MSEYLTLTPEAKKELPIEQAVVQALHAIYEFGFILTQETAALKKFDKEAIDAVQNDKVTWAREYQDWILTLNERKNDAKTVSQELKDKLREAYRNFAKITDENARTLRYKKTSAERMLKIIVNAAKDSVPDAPNYGSDGFYGIKKDTPISFKVNETL